MKMKIIGVAKKMKANVAIIFVYRRKWRNVAAKIINNDRKENINEAINENMKIMKKSKRRLSRNEAK